MNEPPIPDFGAGAPDLTEAILARTSGSPCRRLEALACDLADGTLAPAQRSLAQGHLAHCPACRALVAALEELSEVLPSLALLDPGEGFAGRVLEACRPALPSFRTTWLRLMRRPLICLEAAYLGTVACVVSLQVPVPALHHLPGQVRLARAAQVPPAFRATRAQVLALEHTAVLAASRQTARVRTFWGELTATLRAWLTRLAALSGF